jgi:hypothetical protein
MAVTVTTGSETITSTENDADAVVASIAALDASGKDAKQASLPPDQHGEPAETPESEPATPPPAIAQDREPDGTFKKGGKKDPQSRIAHVTWEREEARRQAAAEKAQREQLEARLQELERAKPSPEPAKPAAADGRPSEDEVGTKYATYADFVDALADWKYDQRMQKFQAEQQQATERQNYQKDADAHGARMAEWRKTNAQQAQEFDSLMAASNGGPQLSPSMVSAILASERGPAMLHYLAAHPEECLRLIRESSDLPVSAAPWVRTVLETKVAAPAASPGPAPAVTRKPDYAPIQPVGASPVVSEVDTSKLTGRAYLEAENARILARRKAQYGLT